MVQFELLEERLLGEGSFGKVYECRWHGTPAAAKFFNIGQVNNSDEVSREIAMIKELRNDYIIQFFGTIQFDGKLCLVTSYAENGSLYGALGRHTLSNEQKPDIITGLIRGMQYLKGNKVVHRDLKSLNVLLDKNYVPKICDFGLAKLKLNSTTHSKTSSFVGTTRWMAPELLQRKPHYSFASDVYALGMVIWEVLTEKRPYEDLIDVGTIIDCIKRGDHEDIPDNIPEHYKLILKNSWHVKPEDRMTVEDMTSMNDRALPRTAAPSSDDIFSDDLPTSINGISSGSAFTFLQQQSTQLSRFSSGDTPTVPDNVDYTETLNQYLQQTTGDLDDASHQLVSIVDAHGASFVQWIQAVANQGNDAAAVVLGEMFYHGCGVPEDYQAAWTQFSKAAQEERSADKVTKQGNARAQNSLGWMYDCGLGVPKNHSEAMEWYTKAAEQGNVVAQFNLGEMYENGRGIPQSDAKAVEWYTKAAEQGFASAQTYLGRMYEKGRGVPQSDAIAIEWYKKAVDQGNAFGYIQLGEMYASGRGVP